MQSSQANDIQAVLSDLAAQVERALDLLACEPQTPAELAAAMRYALMGGGKRLRPAMVLLSARAAACGSEPPTDPMPAAVAVEMVHSYSLVHDDLPAMDNDTMRRGRPTVHVRFGEAMGILVGDALLTGAFHVLAEHVRPPGVAAALVEALARGAGPAGMIAGQVADMELCALPPGEKALEYIHDRKTAALFAAAMRMGAICGGADAAAREAFARFGTTVGRAFQVVDDLLDATATTEQLGKTAGKDARSGKRTYPALLGVQGTAALAQRLSREAMAQLDACGPAVRPLRALTAWMLERQY